MKKMQKALCTLLLFFALSPLYLVQASAPPVGEYIPPQLVEKIPQDTRDMLRQNQLEQPSLEGITALTPSKLLRLGVQQMKVQIRQPLTVFCAVVAVVLLTAFLEGVKEAAAPKGGLNTVFSTVSSLGICACVAGPVIGCIATTAEALRDCSSFILSFVPVFAGTLTAGGQPLTGATYSMFLFWVCQIISQIAATTLVPLLGIYLAMCMVGAAVPGLQISSIAGGIKSLVNWALGLMLTIFVGLLTIQSLVASSGDAVTVKTTKFLIGSFVPVVGSALSEAFTAAQGYIGLVKTTVGAYGMVVAAGIFLPVLLRVIFWYFTAALSNIICEVFGLVTVGGVLKAITHTLGILIALILSFALLIIISTSVILVVGKVG